MTDTSAKENASIEEQPAVDKPVARIISPKSRSVTHPLEWPVEYDGKVYETVEISRCSAKEIDEWIGKMEAGEITVPPVIRIPLAVWEAMDDDDQSSLDKAASDFMPRRLRAAAGSIPTNDAPTSPSSPTPLEDGPLPKS